MEVTVLSCRAWVAVAEELADLVKNEAAGRYHHDVGFDRKLNRENRSSSATRRQSINLVWNSGTDGVLCQNESKFAELCITTVESRRWLLSSPAAYGQQTPLSPG